MSRETGDALCTQLVRAHGTFQGVGLGEACREKALSLRIAGWLRHFEDGSVELMLQGSTERVDMMCDWIVHGDHDALLETIEVIDLAPPVARYAGFNVSR